MGLQAHEYEFFIQGASAPEVFRQPQSARPRVPHVPSFGTWESTNPKSAPPAVLHPFASFAKQLDSTTP